MDVKKELGEDDGSSELGNKKIAEYSRFQVDRLHIHMQHILIGGNA